MSRCFPYPPPGYVCNRVTGDANLIESIKIKRDTERIKKEKKEQNKRDKEERKKEKKEKEKKREKEKLMSIPNIECTNKRKHDGEGLEKSVGKSWVNKEIDLQMKNDTEAEQLERSSLSEEHGQPVLAESLSYSSDGTQSKTKRIRIEQSSSNGNCTSTTQGKAVRFRLKRKDHEIAYLTNDIPSTSCRTSTPVLPGKDEPCLVAPVPVASKDTKDSTPITVEQFAIGKTRAAHDTSGMLPMRDSSASKAQKKPNSAYEALFGKWVPPQIHLEAVTGMNDEQWMFPCKKQAGQNMLHLESVNGVSGLSCSSSWPRAHLLPEADLCVLPFTVPL